MAGISLDAANALERAIDRKIEKAAPGRTTARGTVTRMDPDGTPYVMLEGADVETPASGTAASVRPGDEVNVTVRGGKMTIDGNYTDPAAGTASVAEVAIVADEVRARLGVFDKVVTDELIAQRAHIGHLDADTAYIRELKSDSIEARDIVADHAKVGSLDADYARIDTANIDTATIRAAWVDALMVQSGLIAHEGVVYELDAIQVNASKIKAGTLDVERLVVTQGGQKYLVHVDAQGTPSYEKLDGNIIEDLTITADKIVAGAITAQKITTENIVGSGGWINLRNGTFNYVNATTGEGIAWDGSHLTLQAASLEAIFSSVKIGGRNLVAGSTHMSVGSGKWADGTFRYSGDSGGSLSNVTTTGLPNTGLAGAIRCTNTGTSTGRFGFAQDVCAGPRVGETFTQTAWVRASTTVNGYFLPLWNSAGSVTGNTDESKRFTFTTSWQRFTWTGTLNGTQVDAYSIGYVYALNLPQNGWVEVCGLQVERGNVATDWSPAPNDLREIGGRNLVLGTGTAYSKAATAVSAGSYIAFDLYDLTSAYSSMGLKLGEKLTVSCDVTLTGAVANTTLKIGTNAAPWEYFGVVATFAAGTSTQHIKATAVVTDSIRTSTGSKFRSRIDCPTAASALTVKASNVKLERSDTATDWTPAPEDLATKVELKITNDEVSTKVAKGSVISSINQTAQSVKIDASKVNIQGVITAINNDTTTTIDGSKITTGSLAIGNFDSSTQGKINNAYQSKTITTVTDLNTLKTTGIYHIGVSGCTNTPVSNWGTVVVDFSTGTKYQEYHPDNLTEHYKRTYADSTWSAWTKVDAVGAAKTATNYIYADSSGIRIASANPSTQNQRLQLTSSAATFYDSIGTQRVKISSSDGVIVGNPSKGRSVLNDNGMTVYDANNATSAVFNSSGMTLSGHNSVVGTVVQASKAVSRTGSTVDQTMLGAEITLGKGKWFVYVYWAFTAAASTSGESTITVSIHRASSANNSTEHTRFFVPTKNYARIGATCVADVTADTEKFYVHGGAGWAQASGTTDSTRIGAIRIA